jgi:hypothetical protein
MDVYSTKLGIRLSFDETSEFGGGEPPNPPRYATGPGLGPTQAPVQWIPCLCWGIKWSERDADHSLLSSAEV